MLSALAGGLVSWVAASLLNITHESSVRGCNQFILSPATIIGSLERQQQFSSTDGVTAAAEQQLRRHMHLFDIEHSLSDLEICALQWFPVWQWCPSGPWALLPPTPPCLRYVLYSSNTCA
jgi:hypothetical protein